MSDCLSRYCEFSGQSINLDKSRVLFSPNCTESVKQCISAILHIPESSSLGTYLGYPLKYGRQKLSDFNFLLDKINGKLNGWKTTSLSLAARRVLIQTSSSAISSYYCQHSLLPKSVCAKIDKLNRSFLWGSTSSKKKIHLVSWDVVTKSVNLGGLGIKKTWLMNTACMAKLLWRIQKNEDCLWIQIAKKKFFHNMNPRFVEPIDFTGSALAKGLKVGWPLFISGIRHTIGNGVNTSLWLDSWCNLGTLRSVISGPLRQSDFEAKVSSIISPNRSWDFSQIPFVLPANIINILASVPLSKYCVQPDLDSWGNSGLKFCSSFAYDLQQSGPAKLSWVWNIKAPPKIRCFLWLCCHKRLPTKSFLLHRNLLSDGVCDSCFQLEDLQHLLWECPRSQAFWRDLGFVPSPLASEPSIASWIRKHCGSAGLVSNLPSRLVFVYGCSTLWYWRNIRLFDPGKPCNPIQDCLTLASEFYHLGPSHTSRRIEHTHLVTWKPPSPGTYKLNTDGSSQVNGNAGCGGAIRDDKGNWKGGFARNLGSATALLSELWALRDGLELAIRLNCLPLIIEIDATSVIDLIYADSVNHCYKSLVDDCRLLLRDVQAPRIAHIYREGNQVANTLASLGRSLSSNCFMFLSSPPTGVEPFLCNDCNGTGSVRIS